MHRLLLLQLAFLVTLLAACGDDGPRLDEEGRSLEGTLEATINVSSPTFGIINLLRASGTQVRVTGRIERPQMQTGGYTFDVNDGVLLEVYEYGSPNKLNMVKAQIGTDGTTIGTETIDWEGPVHLYNSDMIIIAYRGNDSETRQALASMVGQEFAGTR